MSTFKADYIIARQEEIAGNTSSIPVKTVVNGTAKAWVNFNGTGTIAFRASFNATSLSDLGVGIYAVNYTNALLDANYSFVGGGCRSGADVPQIVGLGYNTTAPTTTSTRFNTIEYTSTLADPAYVLVTVNR